MLVDIWHGQQSLQGTVYKSFICVYLQPKGCQLDNRKDVFLRIYQKRQSKNKLKTSQHKALQAIHVDCTVCVESNRMNQSIDTSTFCTNGAKPFQVSVAFQIQVQSRCFSLIHTFSHMDMDMDMDWPTLSLSNAIVTPSESRSWISQTALTITNHPKVPLSSHKWIMYSFSSMPRR